ncbi:MAG: helix-turn-helix domain-containing protein [Mailhella sp.]|nr:helix-turn-helix domain-containing protein [Mailhella sp.]
MFWGERLKEERKRLKIKQKDLAATFGVVHQTILSYEKGKTNPEIDFFEKISKLGFDVQYIITGERSDNVLTAEEKEFLALFRSSPETIKQAVRAVLLSGGNGTVKTVNFNNNSHISNVNIKN